MGPLGSLDICIYKSFDFKGRGSPVRIFLVCGLYFCGYYLFVCRLLFLVVRLRMDRVA